MNNVSSVLPGLDDPDGGVAFRCSDAQALDLSFKRGGKGGGCRGEFLKGALFTAFRKTLTASEKCSRNALCHGMPV
jgi:hypothetical protein